MTLRKTSVIFALFVILFSLAPITAAYASTTGAVGGASVEKGKTAVDFRVGYSDAEKT